MIESGFLGIPRHFFPAHRGDRFYGDAAAFAVFVQLVGMANIADGQRPIKQTGEPLKRGQAVTSQEQLQLQTGLTRKVIRRVLDGLEKGQLIGQQKGQHGTIITICNYATLFCNEKHEGPTEGPTIGPEKGQRRATSEQENKRTREKKKQKTEDSTVEPAAEAAPEPIGLLPAEYTPTHYLAERWAKLAKAQAPWLTPDLDNYRAGILKVQRAVKLTDEGVERLLAFVEGDQFWQRQALSPGSLFKRSERNGLRKLDNLLLSFKKTCDPEDRIVDAVQNVMAGNYRDPFNDANYK